MQKTKCVCISTSTFQNEKSIKWIFISFKLHTIITIKVFYATTYTGWVFDSHIFQQKMFVSKGSFFFLTISFDSARLAVVERRQFQSMKNFYFQSYTVIDKFDTLEYWWMGLIIGWIFVLISFPLFPEMTSTFVFKRAYFYWHYWDY